MKSIFFGKNNHIKIIIPTLNEKKNICTLIPNLRNKGYNNILIVDGNSNDGTVKCAEKMGVHVIQQTGEGKGRALRQAFRSCSDGDIFVIMDADGSMSPSEISSFTKMIEQGADVVKGSRFLPLGGSEDLTAIRRVGNKILTLTFNLMFLTKHTDLCYGYFAFNKKALMKLSDCLTSEKFQIETEICVKSKILNLRIKEIPSFEHARKNGVSNLSTFRDGFEILRLLLIEALTR